MSNQFGWQIGSVVMDARRGKCEVVMVSDEACTMKDAKGEAFTFAFPKQEQVARKGHVGAGHETGFDPKIISPAVVLFLLEKATLYAEVRSDLQDKFNERYDFCEQDDAKCLTVVDGNKWGNELRIRIAATPQELDAVGISDAVIPCRPGVVEVNSNRLWWKLHRMGFRLGKRHDAVAVKREVESRVA